MPDLLMRTESNRIPLVTPTGESAGDAEVSYGGEQKLGENRRCVLRLVADGIDITEESTDYFTALRKVREKLEARGLLVVCYGASRNVWPSGMGLDMGAGLRAYRHALGQLANPALVDIFDNGPDVDVATVAEQRAWFEDWLSSRGISIESLRESAKPAVRRVRKERHPSVQMFSRLCQLSCGFLFFDVLFWSFADFEKFMPPSPGPWLERLDWILVTALGPVAMMKVDALWSTGAAACLIVPAIAAAAIRWPQLGWLRAAAYSGIVVWWILGLAAGGTRIT